MMIANPILGVFFHWLGGLASGSFYLPYRGVKKWAWETYWLAGGFFSWIIAPSVMAFCLVPDPLSVIMHADGKTIFLAYLFGALWGLGGLTFGLTMRYLGIGLGMAVALGYCAVVGTLTPPVIDGKFGELFKTDSGIVTLIGVVVCLLGIGVTGMAGMSKERELSEEQKKAAVKEFNFTKGFFVATFSGILSACFAIGLHFGDPIKMLTKAQLDAAGRVDLWANLPVLMVVLLGGFTTNFIWCVLLNIKNKTGHEYFSSTVNNVPARENETIIETALDAPSEEVVEHIAKPKGDVKKVPLLGNYLFSAAAGITWYLQFFFYSMGQMRMGKYEFSSWTLHMASIIIFSTLWGITLKEWKGSSKKTHVLIAIGLAVLIFSTVVVGFGNYLGTLDAAKAVQASAGH